MDNLEFLKFIPVTGEKHLGIAVIRIERKYVVRFKIQASEQGGYWVSSPSMKSGVFNGKDSYVSAFQFDSSYENEEVKNFILANVERHISSVQQPVAQNQYNSGSVAQHQNNYYQGYQTQNNNQNQYRQQSFGGNVQDENIPF